LKIMILHASAGAGHRKAAEALHHSFTNCAPDAQVEKIDILDYTNPFFKKAYPEVYIFLVTHIPLVWGLLFDFLNFRPLKPLINPIRLFFNKLHAKPMLAHIIKEQPDVVVCEHFMSAQLMSHLKRTGKYKGHVVVGVTDFGVHQFWVNKGTDYYFVASDITQKELIQKGIEKEKIMVTGIPIEEKFSKDLDKAGIRKTLGLDPDKFTVLVTSGGFGVGPIKEIVERLDAMENDLQIAVVCGKNKGMFDLLSDKIFGKTVKAFGYVHNMDEFMEAADLIVSKSGGLTVSESLAKGLPMIIIKPIPGQETRNAEIIEEYRIGMRLHKVENISEQVKMLLLDEGKLLKEMQSNANQLAKPRAAEGICQWIIKELLSTN